MRNSDKYIVQQRKHHIWHTVEILSTKKRATTYANVISTEKNPTRVKMFSQRKYKMTVKNIISTLVLMAVAIVSSFFHLQAPATAATVLFFAMLAYTLFVIFYRKNDGLFW